MSDTSLEKKRSNELEKQHSTAVDVDVEGADVANNNELHRGLKNRHAQMIS